MSPYLQFDAEQEHQIALPGLDIAFNHATKTAFCIDQTGNLDIKTVEALDHWFTARGWFLHWVSVLNREDLPKSNNEDAQHEQ